VTSVDDALTQLRAGVQASDLEDGRLEFKEEDASLKRTLEILADAVVCLANADGGEIVVGVADTPDRHGSILGVSSALSAPVVVRGIFDRTRPQLSVPVSERELDGSRLLVITVPVGATFYSNAKGTATRRVGTQCQPFPPEQQKQALASRGLHDWSAELSGQHLDAVDADEMARLRRVLLGSGRGELAVADDRSLLRDLRIATVDGELTNAGLLLVGRGEVIRESVPVYGYAYQYRPTAGSEATGRLRETRAVLTAVERILDAVETRLTVHPLNTASGVQLQLYDYPLTAVRELVVNALVHRDYEAEGSVDVEHTPERMTVSSPGGLVFGVTPQNILTHPSTPRNRLLLETVTALGVAERTGQGVDRVYREVLRVGKPPPEYLDDDARAVVVLQGGTGNDSFARYVGSILDPAHGADLEILLALAVLRSRQTLRAEHLAPRIQRSPGEAQTVLERMTAAQIIGPSRRTARHRFPSYALTTASRTGLGRALSYHRRDSDGLDDKVVQHVNEYGHITNQTLRRLFDLGVYAARDLLKDMQGRGLLVKLGDRTGGPGVRYGPGPTFPAVHDGREADGPSGRRRRQ
jgi:ATP-dependent DNA helicase RecG